MVYSEFYGICSNNIAEAKAILNGVYWYINNGYTNVMELDSQIIIKMINGTTIIAWQVAHLIKKIKDIRVHGNFVFQHCYREVNSIADFFANM